MQEINTKLNDPFGPKDWAEWLNTQPVVEADRKRVCDALWNLSQNSPHHFAKEAGTAAFCTWAGPGQATQLMQLVEAGHGTATEVAIRLKLPGLAAALCKRAEKDWGARGGVLARDERGGGEDGEER